jgi:prophage antirepressor-like protein
MAVHHSPGRVVTSQDQPWFVAADVCRALGLDVDRRGAGHFLSRLHAAERNTVSNKVIVSESGLYKLIMRSEKPEARAFQDWVTRDEQIHLRRDPR